MIGQIFQLYQLWNKLSFEWLLLAVLLKNVLFSARGLPIVGPGVSPENIHEKIKINIFCDCNLEGSQGGGGGKGTVYY